MEIKYNVLGKITLGGKSGGYVKIINDKQGSGGFYIYELKDINGNEGFDSWVENENDVKGFIKESGWEIEWIKQ